MKQQKSHKQRTLFTFTSIFWSKKVQIPLLIAVLPPFTMDTGIWKHWLEKTKTRNTKTKRKLIRQA